VNPPLSHPFMPRYTFDLRTGESHVTDDAGVRLPDRVHAVAHAVEVAQDLMRCREPQTRAWCLEVYEEGEHFYQLPFAKIDATLDHLSLELRATVEQSYASVRSAREILRAARATVRESRALVARSRGKPYLAAESGEPTIREA
jgi:hypothetical protein